MRATWFARDDGAAIDVVNRGYWRADDDVMARLIAGEDVGEAELYYRTAFVFQTAAPQHLWLTESQFVGHGASRAGAGLHPRVPPALTALAGCKLLPRRTRLDP